MEQSPREENSSSPSLGISRILRTLKVCYHVDNSPSCLYPKLDEPCSCIPILFLYFNRYHPTHAHILSSLFFLQGSSPKHVMYFFSLPCMLHALPI
jgi:hypothetical protein